MNYEKQLNKQSARKLYNQGGTIYLIANKVRFDFDNHWIQPFELSKGNQGIEIEDLSPTSFDSIINSFEYYNCNSELGYYTRFYNCTDYDKEALLYAEKWGIIEYSVNLNIMTYYTNYPTEHNTYKCIVNLDSNKETRTPLKRYYKKYNFQKCL